MKATVGRIVHFFPGSSPHNALPNNMPFAPAIVTQTFDGDMINATAFLANPVGDPYLQLWSIHHKDSILGDGQPYWEWPIIQK